MYVDLIIEKTLKESKLKRVRIKVDPSELAIFGYEKVSSFEGYILEEGVSSVRVFMVGIPAGINPIQTVDRQHITPIEPCPPSPKFFEFKSKILQHLEKEGISKDTPQYQQIQNCNNPEFIDTYLKELKFDDGKIANLYKAIFLTENIMGNIMKGVTGSIMKNKLSKMANPEDSLGSRIGAGLKEIGDNKLFKLAHGTTKAAASLPGLVVGKSNIIARVSSFIRSLDVNDLIKFKERYPVEGNKVKKDSIVLIKNLDRSPLKGKIEKEERTHWVIKLYNPQKYNEKVIYFDYSPLKDPNHGTITYNFEKEEKNDVKVEVEDNTLILTVKKNIDKTPDSSGEIKTKLDTKTIDTSTTPSVADHSDKKIEEDARIRIDRILKAYLLTKEEEPDNYTAILNKLTSLYLKDKSIEDKLIQIVSDLNTERKNNEEKDKNRIVGPGVNKDNLVRIQKAFRDKIDRILPG